jgi:anaerobic carbon-monoxide dehydrogenase iron sulfur subunit
MRIKVDKKKCSGCHLCEMACSLFHLGVLNIEKSAIRIDKDDLGASLNRPVVCRQCKEMKCLQEEETTEDLEKREFVWNKVRAKRCPFNALSVLGENAYHCNLCGGNPECIRVCTPKAITLTQ